MFRDTEEGKTSLEERYKDNPLFTDQQWSKTDFAVVQRWIGNGPLTIPALNFLLDDNSPAYDELMCGPNRDGVIKTLRNYREEILQAASHAGQLNQGLPPEDVESYVEQMGESMYGPRDTSDPDDMPF